MTSNASPIIEYPLVLHKRYYKSPYKKLIFFTIKYNGSDCTSRWLKIGKINDWCRRYSSHYFIVRGMTSGVHFHGLLLLDANLTIENLRPQKGIHFCYSTLGDKRDPITTDELEWMREGKEFAEYIHEGISDKILFDLHVEQREQLESICASIKRYWINIRNKVKTKERKQRKRKHIDNVHRYLLKNLHEEREDELREFKDWIYKP